MNSWKACEIQHLLSPELALLEVLSGVISFVANNGLHAVAKRRAEFFFKKWNHSHRAKELEGAEEDLRSHMDSTVERAIRGKRIALFAEMLEFHDFPDKGVVDELLIGASLTGEVVETGRSPSSLLLRC